MRVVNRGPAPVRVSALGRQRSSQFYNYHAAGAALLGAIGEYCSYCETPLSGNAAVEHIVSKSTSTQLETRWENFLLACVNCNSTKGAGKVDSVNDLPNFVWPCVPVDTGPYLSTEGAFDYYWDANAGSALVRAAVGPKATQADKTLRLVGLNKAAANDPAMKDRRIFNRTQTWTVATGFAQTYLPLVANNGVVQAGFGELLEAQVVQVARARGFWSVWHTVFATELARRDGSVTPDIMPEAVQAAVLVRLFGPSTFPGTYVAGTPLPPNYTGLPVDA